MIIGFHHLSLAVANLDAAVETYTLLLGRDVSLRTVEHGKRCAYFSLENMALRIVAADAHGQAAASRDLTTATDCVPFELCFGIANADSARQRLKKISLWPEEIRSIEIRDQDGGAAAAAWRALTFKEPRSTVLDIGLAETVSAVPLSEPAGDAPVLRNELVVIKTAAPEQALAFYGARLGLGLRFDRTMSKAGSRLAQFSCGSSLLEISHDAAAAAAGTPDTIWGIGWSVASAEAAHRRLAAAGRNVSDVKDGAAPGTRVFTARDGTCGLPTIFVEHVGIR